MILQGLILLLLLGSAVVIGLERVKIRFGLIWLTSLVLSMLALAGIVWAAWRLPIGSQFNAWVDTPGLFGGENWLVLDLVSWPLAFSMVTLGFAAVMSSLIRTPVVTPGNLAGILALTGLGVAAVCASSITALLFAWTALDVYELLLQLANTRDRQVSERIVVSFSGHLMGTALLLLAVGLSRLESFDMMSLPEQANLLIVLSAAFRLGVLPVQPPLLPVLVPKHGIQTVMRLAPVAGTISVLARAASIGVPESWKTPLLVIVLAAAVYGALNWFRSPNDTAGRPYWIMAFAALGVVAVVLESPVAVISWGVSLVAGGGILFLRAKKGRTLLWLYLVSAFLMAGLPFTPAAGAADLIAGSGLVWALPVLLILVLILAGYVRHASRQEPEEDGHLTGVYALYIAGLALGASAMAFTGVLPQMLGSPAPTTWWPGAVVVAILLAAASVHRLGIRIPDLPLTRFTRWLSLRLVYGLAWRGYRSFGRGVGFLSKVLEGQSALLWAVLLLAFLIAIFSQLGVGA